MWRRERRAPVALTDAVLSKISPRKSKALDPGAGFEPAFLGSEPSVLPLDDPGMSRVGLDEVESSPHRSRAECAANYATDPSWDVRDSLPKQPVRAQLALRGRARRVAPRTPPSLGLKARCLAVGRTSRFARFSRCFRFIGHTSPVFRTEAQDKSLLSASCDCRAPRP